MEEQKNNQQQQTENEAVSETVEEIPEAAPAVEETSVEETPVEEAPVEEAPVEEVPAEEAVSGETPAEPARKATPGKIAVAVGTVVLLAAVLIALIVNGQGQKQGEAAPESTEVVETAEATIPADGNPDDVSCKGSYSVSDEEAIAQGDVVVATMGEYELTNDKLQVYYWMELCQHF